MMHAEERSYRAAQDDDEWSEWMAEDGFAPTSNQNETKENN